jgi:hypothetical protein
VLGKRLLDLERAHLARHERRRFQTPGAHGDVDAFGHEVHFAVGEHELHLQQRVAVGKAHDLFRKESRSQVVRCGDAE